VGLVKNALTKQQLKSNIEWTCSQYEVLKTELYPKSIRLIVADIELGLFSASNTDLSSEVINIGDQELSGVEASKAPFFGIATFNL